MVHPGSHPVNAKTCRRAVSGGTAVRLVTLLYIGSDMVFKGKIDGKTVILSHFHPPRYHMGDEGGFVLVQKKD